MHFLHPNPYSTTHWEPSGSTPGPHLLGLRGPQIDRRLICRGGRRPIVARLRRANGRSYGRPDSLDLRSLAYLKLGLSAIRATHFASSSDRGGMERKAPSDPTFFTERTLAVYLSVSDRTIRNWIRRGELPSYKLGAARRIDPVDVDAFLEVRREEGP
jgi:excisionase family DNA binding protein